MGTRIEAVGIAHAWRGPFPPGARKLADAAARDCFARAHLEPRDVELLVNAGVYREDNLAEPALASMIQEDIGANLGHPPDPLTHGTFSFDVANGACGVLTALDVVNGFIRSGAIRRGLVVASDSIPAGTKDFPFPAVGGAVLARADEQPGGFVDFQFSTYEPTATLESTIGWHERKRPLPLQRPGKNVLRVIETQDYSKRVVACAVDATRRFVRDLGLDLRAIDLVVIGQSPAGFTSGVVTGLELDPLRAPEVDAKLAGAHSAGSIVALEAAMRSPRWVPGASVLFVAAGAGIVVGTALYRV